MTTCSFNVIQVHSATQHTLLSLKLQRFPVTVKVATDTVNDSSRLRELHYKNKDERQEGEKQRGKKHKAVMWYVHRGPFPRNCLEQRSPKPKVRLPSVGYGTDVKISPCHRNVRTSSFAFKLCEPLWVSSLRMVLWATMSVWATLSVWATVSVWATMSMWATTSVSHCNVWTTMSVWATVSVWTTLSVWATTNVWATLSVWTTASVWATLSEWATACTWATKSVRSHHECVSQRECVSYHKRVSHREFAH